MMAIIIWGIGSKPLQNLQAVNLLAYNKFLKRNNNSWPSLRDYTNHYFSLSKALADFFVESAIITGTHIEGTTSE